MQVIVSYCTEDGHVLQPDAANEHCLVCGKETPAFHDAEIGEKVREQLANDPHCYD